MGSNVYEIDKDGFKIVPLLSIEALRFLREYISGIIFACTNHRGAFENTMPDYLHQKISNKETRLLSHGAIKTLRDFGVFENLANNLNNTTFKITDEECFGREEIYWRYVRPNSITDVGPLHADGWFWNLNREWKMPTGTTKRLKVWAPIQVDRNLSGLKVIPGSHTRPQDFPFDITRSGSKWKPAIVQPIRSEAELISISPGDAIIFDDLLIHGGAVTRGGRPRVSIEFTVAMDK